MKAKTRQEIAAEYGICTKTLKKWLLQSNLSIPKGLIPPSSLKQIYEQLGNPLDS